MFNRQHQKSQTICQVSNKFHKIMSQFEENNVKTLLKSRGDPFCLLSVTAINSCRDLLLEPGRSWWCGWGAVTAVMVGRTTSVRAWEARRPGAWHSSSLSYHTAMSDPALNHHDNQDALPSNCASHGSEVLSGCVARRVLAPRHQKAHVCILYSRKLQSGPRPGTSL